MSNALITKSASSFQYLDFLPLGCQCSARRRDTTSFLLALVDPPAQGRLYQPKRMGCISVAVALVKHQAGSFALELGGEGTSLSAHRIELQAIEQTHFNRGVQERFGNSTRLVNLEGGRAGADSSGPISEKPKNSGGEAISG